MYSDFAVKEFKLNRTLFGYTYELKNYLISQGVSATIIKASSKGEIKRMVNQIKLRKGEQKIEE